MTKYTDYKQWLRALAKVSVHAGTGAILTGFGTNGVAAMVPSMADIALNVKQAVAVFIVSALLTAIKFIHESTSDTVPPIPPKP